MKSLFKSLVILAFLTASVFSFTGCEKDIPEETYSVTVFSCPKSELSKYLNLSPKENESTYSKELQKSDAEQIKNSIKDSKEYEWTQTEIEDWMKTVSKAEDESEKTFTARTDTQTLISYRHGYFIILGEETIDIILKYDASDIGIDSDTKSTAVIF